jgi:hypothetical protein
MGTEGPEHTRNFTAKTANRNPSGAKSGATDDGLTRVIDAWPGLAPDVKAAILRMLTDE